MFRLHFKELTLYQPWDKPYLDTVGALNMNDGHRYILACQDNLSKHLLAISMMTQTADEVSLTFLHHVVLQYGIPNSI
jgi:hypothetical protein